MFPVIEFYTEFIWGQEVTQLEVQCSATVEFQVKSKISRHMYRVKSSDDDYIPTVRDNFFRFTATQIRC